MYDKYVYSHDLIVPHPTITSSLNSHPIDNNLFNGIHLNLTCYTKINVCSLDEFEEVTVTSVWRKNNNIIMPDHRLTWLDTYELGDRQYQATLQILSLDKNRDEGNYSCTNTVLIYQSNNNTLTLSSLVSLLLQVPSKFVNQLYFID